MSAISVEAAASGEIVQPSTASLLYARSTASADTGTLTVYGTVSAAHDNDPLVLIGQREKASVKSFSAILHVLLSATQTGTVTLYQAGTKASGDLRFDVIPANNDTLTIGLAGFTQVYTWKTTLTGAANEIHIGADRFIAARNAGRAIIAGTGAGTDYGTGTVANAFVNSWADSAFTDNDLNGTSEVTVYLRDLIGCSRQLAWSVSSSSANISTRAPSGGADGTLLATIAIAATQAYTDLDLGQSETVAVATVPASLAFISDPITCNGGPVTLNYAVSGAGTMLFSYETSTDGGTTWRAGVTALTATDSSTFRTTNCGEAAIQTIRIKGPNPNANVVARNVFFKVIRR